jgi:hypothetical protein
VTTSRFNLREARKKRDDAIDKVERGATDQWMRAAKWAIVEVAMTHQQFTTDEVWASGLPDASENRAMGAAIVAASRAEIIDRTNYTRESKRVSSNARPVRVWQSRIWQPS